MSPSRISHQLRQFPPHSPLKLVHGVVSIRLVLGSSSRSYSRSDSVFFASLFMEPGSPEVSRETSLEAAYKDLETPDVHNTAQQLERANRVYKEIARVEDPPTTWEMFVWYFYGLCSQFVYTVLLPIVFPLILSQMVRDAPEPEQGWGKSFMGLPCRKDEMQLYQDLRYRSISVGGGNNLSPLHWASISWAIGVFISAPVLAGVAFHLDHGNQQQLISGVAIVVGALFCLPAGFFKSPWPFPPYTSAIVAAHGVALAAHTRHMGLIVRGLTGPAVSKRKFPVRRAVGSWLSLCGAAAGSVGASVIAAFTLLMLRRPDPFTSLWVVSIFGGLKWLAGIGHAVFTHRPAPEAPGPRPVARLAHAMTVFEYPHAAGTLAGVLFASFAASCIFTGGLLYLVGELCLRPLFVFCVSLAYFTFPTVSLPLLHPLQLLFRTDAMRMQLLGFLLSAVTSGTGYLSRHKDWSRGFLLVGAIVQSTSAGILHSFGRVLLMDCSPPGREGALAAWFAWTTSAGTCAGFAVATAFPGDVGAAFGAAFCAVAGGAVVLVFGNVSHLGGAVAAGHVRDEESSEKGSPSPGKDGPESH
ncbi:hypothetical protein H6P81_007306 [Aristolochia fimbriata]|uniref:Uncharacterized protein n=1 Tax=Aristolochia fimbriata TaxID=158543 RepID=A0AAV7EZY8_ARIFI|nr:hypothetical protein H6P81_007306 [Aristolochia fimbriata]